MYKHLVTLQYLLNDLSRQRTRTLTLLTCLALSTASATFLLLMGLSLGVNFATVPWRFSLGVNYVFSQYIVIALILSLLTGVLLISNVQISFTDQRIKDIGIMKAIGLVGEASSFLFFETIIITIVGCLIGTAFGIIINLASIVILNALGYGLIFSLAVVPTLILFIIVISISFASAYFPIRRTFLRLNAVEAISGNFAKKIVHKNFLEKASRSPFYKVALRSLTVKKGETLRIIVTCTICMILVSTIIFGGQTVSSTVNGYVERGIGDNILLIANPQIANNYVGHLSFYPSGSSNQNSNVSWLNPSYGVNNSFINWLNVQPFIETVDARIVTNSTALEMSYIEPVETDSGPSYTIIGDSRSTSVLVVGINPGNVTSNWVLDGRFLTNGDNSNAVIGDSVLNILTNSSLERIAVAGKAFSIVGTCIDPLNMGYTIYIPYDVANSTFKVSNPNVVLIKVKADATTENINAINQTASQSGLEVLNLNSVLDRNRSLIGGLMNSILIYPIMTLISLIICLIFFFQLKTLSSVDDFRVMRALGGRWKDILKIISVELFIIIIASVPLGVLVGLIIALKFLIFTPTPPQIGSLLLSFGIILGFTIILFVVTRYSIAKTVKNQILHV